ncbi:MAG: helix-turn-helix transcriptional regulator [Pseudomonadota bacterium]|nr:helix-turn-helix transcriptional regulator [Pseudomonadota bacterium]
MKSVDQRSSDPAIIIPTDEQWQSTPVKLTSDEGEIRFRSAAIHGVTVAAIDSEISILDSFSPPPDTLYFAILQRFPSGNMLNGVELPNTGVVVLEGGRDYLTHIPVGTRVAELTVPKASLENSEVSLEWVARQSRALRKNLLPYGSPQRRRLESLMLASLEPANGVHPLEYADGVQCLMDAAGDLLRISQCAIETAGRAYRPGRYRVVRRAREYIESAYSDDIGVAGIAAHAACSPRTLQLAFRDVLGITPGQYLMARRLFRARKLLAGARGASISVTEAAELAGFRHRGRFSQVYKSFFGETPTGTLSSI